MFETKDMYIIYCSHGEYDDYTTNDVLIVPDKDTALILVDEYNNHDSIFFKKFEKWYGEGYIPHDINFSYKIVPYFEL